MTTAAPRFDPHFERALRDGADVESRLVYADWFETRGEMSRAEALRSYRPPLHVPAVELRVGPDPEDIDVRQFEETHLPLVILVYADFTLRADPRPIIDRREIRVGRDRFARVMEQHDLRFEVAVDLPGRPAVEVAIRRPEDFAPERLRTQLASSASLQGVDLEPVPAEPVQRRPWVSSRSHATWATPPAVPRTLAPTGQTWSGPTAKEKRWGIGPTPRAR